MLCDRDLHRSDIVLELLHLVVVLQAVLQVDLPVGLLVVRMDLQMDLLVVVLVESVSEPGLELVLVKVRE